MTMLKVVRNGRAFFLYFFTLVESYVGDDLSADSGVEFAGDGCSPQCEFLTEDGGLDFDMEGLVLDERIADIV